MRRSHSFNVAQSYPHGYAIKLLIITAVFLTVSMGSSAKAQCCGAEPSIFKQPDGTELEIHFHGNELYTRTTSSDGYTLFYDASTRAYYYADLNATGDELVSSGKLAKPNKPADLNFAKNLDIKPEARKKFVEKRKAEFETVRKDKENWQQQKQKMEDYRAWKKKQKAEGKKKSDGSVESGANQTGDAGGTSGSGEIGLAPPVNPPTLGDVLGLTILVDFSDVPARSDLTRADFDDYLNKPGGRAGWGNKGSIRDYFYAQSNGRLRYNNNVTYYVRVPNTYAYYNDTALSSGTNGRRLLTDAINQLKADGYDFSGLTANAQGRVIATNLLWAGNDSGVWSKGLWPHRWALSSPLSVGGGLYISDYQCTDIGATGTPTMGTFCHENGHLVGKYPDYYDYDGVGQGVGKHCLMGGGNHATQTNPTNISGYLKYHSGWMDAIELTSLTPPVRLAAQVDGTIIYKYTNPDSAWPNEYFLIENRSKVGGWESTSGLPDSGLMISHIHHTGDMSRNERTETQHYEHSIEQAEGNFELEGAVSANQGDTSDYFHSGDTGPKTEFSDTTLPNAKWWKGAVAGDESSGTNSGLHVHSISSAGSVMTFVYGTGTPSAAASTQLTTSILENAVDYGGAASAQAFSIFNAGGGTLSYTVSDDAAWLSCNVTSGTATTETDVVTVTYSTSGLAAGTHTGTITIDGGTGGIETISVTMVVRNQPFLTVSPSTLSITGVSGLSGYTGEFDIKNTGGGTASYTITKTQPWLSILPASGTVASERDTIVVTCNATSLAPGTYNDTITLTSAAASNSPLTIAVSFVVDSSDMILSAPNGGETWYLETNRTITWASSLGGNVKIELFKGGLLDSTIAASTTNDGSYIWTVPAGQTPGNDYKIKITSVENITKSDQSFTNFTIGQDLLALALDTSGLSWTASGDASWFRTTTPASLRDGVDAAESGNIGHGQSSSMETTVVGPGTMTFWWKVSSESNFDFLRLYLNNVEQTGSLAKISGSVAWVQKTVTIPTGSTVVKWTYSKDTSADGGSDTAWVDQVVYTPDSQADIVVEDSTSSDLTDAGSTVGLGSVNTGSSSSAYTFTIRNSGTQNLTGLAVSKTGTHSADYTVGALGATTLAPGASTTFSVTFTPGAAGIRTAALQIASNDPDENPFDINLTGTGVGPGSLAVSGASGLVSSGNFSGSFSPSSIQYTLNNPGGTSINWTAAKTQSWVTLSASGGTLAAGASTTVTVTINTAANSLNVGSYNDTVTFTNTTNSNGNTTRAVNLTVNPIPVTLTLGNLLQTYDGTSKAASVTTNPVGIAHSVTYNGSSTLPTNAGTYAVVATVTQSNHSGTASGDLVIAYTVSYNGNSNTVGTAPSSQTKFQGVDLTLASNTGNLGKTNSSFIGWNTSADGNGTDYAAGGVYSGNASITLYAKWAAGTDATWIQTNAGPFNWSDGANWSGGVAASGADRTASFTSNITAAQTVNLSAPVTIGNITFTDSTTSSHNLTISGANVLTLSRSSGEPTIDVTQSGRTLAISSEITGGNGLQKNGLGILTLSGTNTYSGGTVINGGTLNLGTNSDSNLGATTGELTFTGTGTITYTDGLVLHANRNLILNSGANVALSNAITVNGVLSGSGSLSVNTADAFIFSSPNNTFSGMITSRAGGTTGYGLDMASIGDGAGAGLINLGNTTTGGTFRWIAPSGTGTTTLLNRQFALSGTTGVGAICARGATSSDHLIITKDLLISGTGNKKLILAGTNTGNNAFAGNIADGSGSLISLEKTEGGTWILSGTNTYTGITNLAANGTTGRLIFQGAQSLSPNTQIDFNQNSSNVQSVSFLSDSVGTINAPVNFQRPITFVGANTTQSMNIFVGNTSNGTGAGTSTGSVIGVGDITWNNATQAANTTRTFFVTGANGYSLKTGNFTLPNLSTRTAASTWTNVFNPTSASLIIGGNITMASGNNVDGGIPVLELGGTATGNLVLGSISDAADVATTNRPLSLTKTGNGTWAFSGNNTYTGTTTVSAGKLFINGDQSASTGAVSVANNATLGGNGKLGGNVTIAAGGKLEFDISTYRASHNPLDLTSGKNLTFSGASTLTITSSGGAAPGVYTLVTGGNNISGVAPTTVNLPSGWVATVSVSGNSLLLHVTSTGGPTYALSVANGTGDGSYEAGTEIAVVADTPPAEQIFVNWTTAHGGTIANANASSTTYTMPANAATLTANYITNLFTVSYHANGATSGTAPGNQTKTRDVDLTLATNSGNLSRTNYTFGGWNTAADGSGTNYATGATYTANAAVTLYAKWNTQFDVWVTESGGGGGGGGEAVTFTGDSNTDGVPDGVAWLLGTESLTNNAAEILPVPQPNNGAVSVNFDYLSSAVRGVAKLKLQYSATLQANSWTTVEIPAVSSTVDGVEFVITPIPDTNLYDIQATVPASAANGGGKVFVRLMGEVTAP